MHAPPVNGALSRLVFHISHAGQLFLRQIRRRRHEYANVFPFPIERSNRRVAEAGPEAPADHDHPVGSDRQTGHVTRQVPGAGAAEPFVEHRLQAEPDTHLQLLRRLVVETQVVLAIPQDLLRKRVLLEGRRGVGAKDPRAEMPDDPALFID
ncbi:hypothetical protein ACFL01_04275, partial [Planctomycetota bacterium]